ncbi:9400_t:CDS:2, partial [Funneliformis geosporum]
MKNLKVGEFASNYTTAFSNLKFLPKFHNFFEGAEYQEPEIRNVINQFKGGHGKTKSGKRLSYQESFSTSGNYEHILEIEPVNLGIENFPPITRL